MNAAYSALSNSSFGPSIDSPALTSAIARPVRDHRRLDLGGVLFLGILARIVVKVSVVTGCEGCKRRGSSQV